MGKFSLQTIKFLMSTAKINDKKKKRAITLRLTLMRTNVARKASLVTRTMIE